MSDLQIFYVGVDMSMESFVSAYGKNPDWTVETWQNRVEGIAAFIKRLKELQTPDRQVHVVLEATGNYQMRLVYELIEHQMRVSMLNPKQSKGFLQGVLLSTTKTDAQDACGLALYGLCNAPQCYRFPDEQLLKVRQLRTYLGQLKKHKGQLVSQLHALDYHIAPLDFVVSRLKAELETCESNIMDCEKELHTTSEAHYEQAYQLALTVSGIGPSNAQALLIATNSFKGFDNAKQVAKFIGICPTQKESGKSLRARGSIAKTGQTHLRGLLYMAARSAKRYNPACKALYERIRAKGKCHNVAMVAVCNKLVHQVFAVVTKEIPFDPAYHLKYQTEQMKQQHQA
jgi:transposase